MSNFLSYSNIFKDRELFRKSGTKSGSDFNYTDTPGTKYFKIFFYFMNGDSEKNDENSGGLLAPTWMQFIDERDLYQYNSAWSYLKMNCEDDRADRLENFVNLLSNISAESPWYFSEISGIDTALERKVSEKDFKIEEIRKKISIKCLSDPYDDRISTLLDLYRTIVWDWQSKREIIPANLRKFDMGIFIYNDPVIPFHKMSTKINDIYSGIGEVNSEYKTSYKYIEFHNCEFDYDSSKSGLSTLTNKEGIMPEYTIDIFFDDCYEARYNEFLLSTIGDFILKDKDNPINDTELEQRLNFYEDNASEQLDSFENLKQSKSEIKKIPNNNFLSNAPRQIDSFQNLKQSKSEIKKIPNNNFLSNALGQILSVGADAVTGLVKRAVLGNLYTFSLTKIAKQLKGVVEGDVWSTARGVSEYIKDAKQRKENQVNIGHSLFTKPKKILPTVKRIGNLAKSQTIANNL